VCLRTRRDDHFSGDSSNSHYLAAFNYFPTVAFWLLAGNAALLALIKDDTSFEQQFGRIRSRPPQAPRLSAYNATACGKGDRDGSACKASRISMANVHDLRRIRLRCVHGVTKFQLGC
jgi:hypothetical protein